MPSIIAVIVTYNRKEMLMQCLAAGINQTCKPSKILIVDNSSTDGTLEALAEKGYSENSKIEILALPKNLGGAGGFHHGIKKAYQAGADWVWIMDDDCIPEPDCLEKLSLAIMQIPDEHKKNIGFLSSRVLWQDGTPCLMNLPVPHPLWIEPHSQTSNLARLRASSFVSMLISRSAIKMVGLPVKEFFIWFDDSEYSNRISENNACFLVSDSVVIHKTTLNSKALDLSQLNDQSLWKFSYGIRNETSYHFEKEGFVSGVLFCLKLLFRTRRHVSNFRLRFAVAKACWQGYRFRYRSYIEHV